MNTPSPLVPQGAFPEKGKSHVRITVFAILAIHVVLLGVLLIAGCNKKTGTDVAENPVPPVPAPPAGDQWPPAGQPNLSNNDPSSIPPVPPPIPPDASLTPTPGTPIVTPPAPTEVPGLTPIPQGENALLTEHTIVKGETLAIIGKHYGVGYKAIEAANPGINPTRLKIGDKIKIPAKTAAASPSATPAPSGASGTTTYVVKSGDNLQKIAKATGVQLKQLRAANNLRTDLIRVGQKLKIPARSGPPVSAESTAPPPVAPPITPAPIR